MLTKLSERLATRLASAKRKAPGLARLVPIDVRRAILSSLTYRPILESADRVFLERTLIPAMLSQAPRTVLSVGVQKYTSHHPAVFTRGGAEFWTIEIRPEYAKWGSPGHHVTGDVCELERYFSPGTFDAVLLNGVIGFGVDDAALADRAIRAIATVLRGDGWLVIGWDTNRGVDPMALGSTRSYFRRSPLASLPSRIEIDGSPHIYDQLRRVPS